MAVGPKTFAQYQQDVAPFWARQPLGANFLASLGAKKAEAVAIAKQAVQARFPLEAPVDALDAIGHERTLPRYALSGSTPQTDDEYRATLLDAWNLWYWGGTAKGMLDELYRAFQPYTSFRIITQQGRIWSRDITGAITFVDTVPRSMGQPDRWNTFQLWFTVDAAGDLPWSPIPDNASQHAATARAIIAAWKPGHTQCHNIVLVESGYPWGYPGDDTGVTPIVWTTDPVALVWTQPAVLQHWSPT